ncbi:Apoptosis-resistant E3 ubiquitin protein ligase 1-like, partial [Homarus americanus]
MRRQLQDSPALNLSSKFYQRNGRPYPISDADGPPDPSKTAMVQHSSTVVCTASQPHHILIEPRDQYHNVCSFSPGQADTDNYSISIVEEEEEAMVDDPTPSTPPPRNREVLSVCEFWKKYNIKNAVDRIVEAWRKINIATVACKPLFANSEVSGAEQTEASGERQSVAATLLDTVEAARSFSAPGFSNVQVKDLQEIICQHQHKLTIEEMLEDEEEEQRATQEDNVKPGEPTTRRLTELLTTIERFGEQLEEYDTRPHAQNHICLEYKAMYVYHVNARQQALITVQGIWYLRKAQPVNALANITLGDDDGITDDDIEVLGDLLVEELPQDFEGFDTEQGGSSNQSSLPQNPSTSPVKHFTDSIKGEEGLDWGGVRREWFELICAQLFDNNNGLFASLHEGRQALVHPDPYRPPQMKLKHYEFAGRVVGKCLYESALGSGYRQTVRARFTRSFLAQLIGLRVHYKHFAQDDPELHSGKIRHLLDYGVDKLEDELSFTDEVLLPSGQVKVVELEPGGMNRIVTNNNKLQYLDALAQYRLSVRVRHEVDAFLAGLNEIIPDNLLCIFDENELELLMCGIEEYSIADFKANHVVNGSSPEFRRVLYWFWTAVSNFT